MIYKALKVDNQKNKSGVYASIDLEQFQKGCRGNRVQPING